MATEKIKNVKIAIGPLVGEYGGVPQHVKNIIKYSKYDFSPICTSKLSFYYNNNWLFTRIGGRLLKYKIVGADLWGLYLGKIKLPKLKIVHLHGHPYWPEIYLKRKNNYTKYIHTVHQIYFKEDCYSEGEWRNKKYLNELMFKSCIESDVVISVSKWIQPLLLSKGIKSIYIPNGVNPKECEEAEPDGFRKKYKVEVPFYLFGGDIRKYKRPELFVKLAENIPDKIFVMVGNGTTESNLKFQLNIKTIPQNLICIGPLSHSDYLNAISACKVFILPSKNETFGISLIEAMACSKTVVAADNAGPKEIIDENKNGFLFKPDNFLDLIEKAKLAWGNQKVGIEACKKVKGLFDWEVVIIKIDKLYERLIYGK